MSHSSLLEAKQSLTRGRSPLRRLLPRSVDLEKSARACQAIQRKQRKLGGAESLLRLVLAYGFCGLSTRDVAAWARLEGLAELSDVAVLKCVRRSGDWLGYLLGKVMAERAGFVPCIGPSRRVRLLDATTASAPGSTNADWRIHLGYDLGRGLVDEVHLTSRKVGEHFGCYHLGEGEVVIADRGYATRSGLLTVLEARADFIVRLNWTNVPLYDHEGEPFDFLRALRGLADGQVGDFDVTFSDTAGKRVGCRLVACRLPEDRAEQARQRTRRARRKGKVQPATLETAGYVFVLTSLERQDVGADDVLAMYRMRWQVELAFKRLKSLVELDALPADHPSTARAFLLAKLLGAMLVEERVAAAVSVSPPSALATTFLPTA